jgi:putative transposase
LKGFDKTCSLYENGGMKKRHVQLSPADRDYLETLTRQGEQTAKAYRRALALLELDRGQTYTEVSKMLQATIPTISSWAAKYLENGLEVLQDQPRSGRPIEIDGTQRAKITALACSTPPEGYAQWLWNWNTANTFPTPRWDRC